MGKVEVARRSVMRLTFIAAGLALLTVVVLGAIYERYGRESARQGARADVQDRLGVLRSELQGAVDADVQIARALAGVVRFRPDIGPAEFSRLGEELISELPGVLAIAAAPDLLVRMVYPLEPNTAMLGLDYREALARLTPGSNRDLGATGFAGPLELAQGGQGFIAMVPVFLDEGSTRHFWGIATAVIEAEALYLSSGLSNPDLGLDVVLIGGETPAGTGNVFFGDPAILEQDPVTADVSLPNGAWRVAAVPAGGWQAPPAPWGTRAVFALAGLLILAPILGAAQIVGFRQAQLAAIRDREAELSRLSWRFEFALAASEIGVWDVDLETDELLWDERTKELFGFAGRDGPFSETDWAGALHPEDRDRAVAEADTAVKGNGRFVFDYRVLLPDGKVRHVRDMAARYQGADGTRRLVGLVWDTSADVERQEELNLRRLEAEAATLAKSRFLAAMSHEIRTPMSGVLGLLRLMLDDPLPEKQWERAKIALTSAQSLLQILNDILDFSKLEAKQIRIADENIDVRRLLDEVMELMAAPAKQKGLSLEVEVDSGVPDRIFTDPMRLRQVLTNLLSNATKFTDTGEVKVRVHYLPEGAEGSLAVEVEDTGIGIGEAHLQEIFQDFVQADNSLTRRAGGTGLGLAICKQLVELMGGTISLRSVTGMGSTFCFSIRTRPAPGLPDEDAADGDVPLQALPPMRVLLAEDHATNQYLISAYLGAAGHEVVMVNNGAEAASAAAEGGYDVVLMDVQMPEVDGLEATRRIRALPGAPGQVAIVALTANAMAGDRQTCLDAGMDGYLSKPIDVLALHDALLRFRPAAPAHRGSARAFLG